MILHQVFDEPAPHCAAQIPALWRASGRHECPQLDAALFHLHDLEHPSVTVPQGVVIENAIQFLIEWLEGGMMRHFQEHTSENLARRARQF